MNIQCTVRDGGEQIIVPVGDLKQRDDVEPVVCWAHKRFIEQRGDVLMCPACNLPFVQGDTKETAPETQLRQLRLNLACGSDYREGWFNFDVVSWPGHREPDIRWDARQDKIPFPDNSAAEVYMGYTLMHLAPCHHARLLDDVHRVLSPEGVLVVGEVDMAIVMGRWLSDPTDPSLCELIWGEQGSVHGVNMAEWDKHCHGFTEESLRKLLSDSRFTGMERIQVHVAEVFYELTLQCRKG